tara:strand:+ start:197 stop:313 length:117 start_codon:yes stop_codon:yes gene_type:complete
MKKLNKKYAELMCQEQQATGRKEAKKNKIEKDSKNVSN